MHNIDDEDLIYNTSSRIPISLCIDTSTTQADASSVAKVVGKIQQGILELYKQINDSEEVKDSTELNIVTFNNKVDVVQDYTIASKFDESKLKLTTSNVEAGSTDLGSGILKSLELLNIRKQLYNNHGVEYYQPWLIVLTSGKSSGKEFKKNMALARKSTLKLEKEKRLIVLTIYINDGKGDLSQKNLEQLAKNSKKRESKISNNIQTQIISSAKIGQFFEWLSKSIRTLSFDNDIKIDFSGLTDWEDI